MTKRLFVALSIPAADASSFYDLGGAIAGSVNGCRPVVLKEMHVTVRFLGDVQEGQVAELVEKLEAVAMVSPPLRLDFDAVAFAPFNRPPDMLWATYRGGEAFSRLVRDVTAATLSFSQERNAHQEMVAHVTMARFSRGLPEALARQTINQPSIKPLTADRIFLFESRPTEGGHAYYEMASFPLKGAI